MGPLRGHRRPRLAALRPGPAAGNALRCERPSAGVRSGRGHPSALGWSPMTGGCRYSFEEVVQSEGYMFASAELLSASEPRRAGYLVKGSWPRTCRLGLGRGLSYHTLLDFWP